jgi:hypothetical protein
MNSIFDNDYFESYETIKEDDQQFDANAMEALNGAYDQGYYQALCDIDGTNEYDIANEGFSAAYAISGVAQLIKIAKNLIVSAGADKTAGMIIDLDKIIESGYPKDKAVAEYKKTLKFLISKGYVNGYITPKSTRVTYADLTPKGMQFMHGYREAIKSADIFTVKKSIESNAAKIFSAKTVADFAITLATTLASGISAGMIGGPLGIVLMITTMLTSSAELVVAYQRIKNMKEYNKNKPVDPNAKEPSDAENDNSTAKVKEDKAKEDVDIFSDEYFEVATESMQDHIIDRSDFSYMPPKEAEKAYRGILRILVSSAYMTSKGVKKIDPDKGYVTKSDIGIIYGISAVKDIIRKINAIHRFKYKTAEEFLSAFKDSYEEYNREMDRIRNANNSYSNYAAGATMGAILASNRNN